MNPLPSLVLTLVTLALLTLAVATSDVAPGLRLLFVVIAAGGVVLAVLRYRERR